MTRAIHALLPALSLAAMLATSACASSRGSAETTGAGDAPATGARIPPGDPAGDAGDGGAGEAAGADTPAVESGDQGGKSPNPGRPDGGPPTAAVTWDQAPLDPGFPTKGYELFFGQGLCKPEPACQQLKAVKGDREIPLTTRDDVLALVGYMEEEAQALALVRFFTDRRYVLEDERCDEVDVADDGAIDIRWPGDLDPEARPVSEPVKVVGFEGGFRVDRTLICLAAAADEPDRLIRVSETVFSDGSFTREETAVLLEHEMWMPRLR